MPDLLPLLVSGSLKRAGFRHGFTTRAGGVSEPPFETLDFATLRDPAALWENQSRLAQAVGFDLSRLYQTKQVHGRAVVRAEGDPARMLAHEADALVGEPGSGAAVAVRVADCVPVLLADPASGRVAAVHAGWRGVVADVVGAAVRQLVRDGSGLVAAIGPCIGACCFEVDEDVADTIARTTTDSVVVRRDADRGKAFVDLRAGVRTQLRALGLSDSVIEDVPGRGSAGCTRCDAQRFYSYRRDGDASGRLIAVIVAR
ncbi:MAG TPA: peptidoglycan editing factor PgeF [Labilithrix sp.]|nr:peptidoglycan editing factor PgeF [Labilithrix sp.]